MWELPGPSRWLRGLIDECLDGMSGLVVCPSDAHPNDLLTVWEEGVRRDVFTARARDIADGHEARLVEGIRRLVGIKEETTDLSVDTLACEADLGRVTVVIDARLEQAAQQAHWASLAQRFAASCKDMPRTTRPRLWVLVTPPDDGASGFSPEVGLKVRWWWGVLSSIDTQLAARNLDVQPDLVHAAAEIARWDLDLLTELRSWDGALASIDRFISDTSALAVSVGVGRSAPRIPAVGLVDAWRRRMVESWDGELSLHVAAERATNSEAASTRIWLSQVVRFTPVVELERTRLAEELHKLLRGRPLKHDWSGQDILSLEPGPLFACYRAHLGDALPPLTRALLSKLVWIRNCLSHRDPLDAGEFAELRRLIAERSER